MSHSNNMKKRKIPIFSIVVLLGFGILIAMVLTGNKTWYSTEPPMEFLSDMDNQFKAKPQSGSTFFADRASIRPIVENTVPRDGELYPLEKPDFDKADSINGENPLPNGEYVLARGKNRFDAMCSPCHNYNAKGSGMVVQRGFQNPPSLLDEHAVGLSDAHIFHIISAGQNIMSGYADKLKPNDRWALIHYIRHLQQEQLK